MTLPLERVRIGVLALVAALTVWSAYLWLRNSSLVRVHDVKIEGVHGRYSRDIERTLETVGKRMTTMHVRESDLERSVRAFPVVQSVSASASFPNDLHITVHEYAPVAKVTTAEGRRVAAASDGTLLPRLAGRKLPSVRVDEIPSSGKIVDVRTLQLVRVLAESPRALRPLAVSAAFGPGGIRVTMRDGPMLYFGSPDRPAAKWAAAARVIGDVNARGARYVDVRVAERPVVGTTPPRALVSAGSSSEKSAPATHTGQTETTLESR